MNAAQQLGKLRWADKTDTERSEHMAMMARSRHRKLTKRQRSAMMKKVRAAGKQK